MLLPSDSKKTSATDSQICSKLICASVAIIKHYNSVGFQPSKRNFGD